MPCVMKVLPTASTFAISSYFGKRPGPALNAELNYPGGIAFGPDGDLYIVDEANNRVRRVVPDGAITTVLGAAGRWKAPDANGTPALQARLLSPEDVTFGPGGGLYIADPGDNEVLRLGDGPAGITFGRAGDLFIFGVNTKALLMVDPHGVIHAIIGQKAETGFFPHSRSGIVTAPDGEVFGLDGTSLDRITTTGARTRGRLHDGPVDSELASLLAQWDRRPGERLDLRRHRRGKRSHPNSRHCRDRARRRGARDLEGLTVIPDRRAVVPPKPAKGTTTEPPDPLL